MRKRPFVRLFAVAQKTVILWNTVYLERAVNALREHGVAIDPELLKHLSPIGWTHIALTGDYTWQAHRRVARGRFRPLRPIGPGSEA